MKRKLLILSALLFASIACVAQTTAVTATVTDSDGTVWANGTWKLTFQPGPYQSNPAAYTLGGVALDPAVVNQTGSMDGSGVLSFTTDRSTSMVPIGSSYNLTICPNASAPCSTINFSASAASLDLTTTINAAILAPRFQAVSGSFGYTDAEAITQLRVASTYWNVTLGTSRCYTGSAWGACSAAGSSGFPITLGATAIAAGSTTTAVTGLTIDGVTPTIMGYLDATSSIQTQLDSKQASGSYVLQSTTVNGHPLSSNVTVAPADLAAGALANGMTATTQAAADNSTKLATTAYVDTAVAGGGGTQVKNNAGSTLATSTQDGMMPYKCADSSGSGTAQTCTTGTSFTLTSGNCFTYTTTTTNSGTGLTINVNSLGAKSVAIPGASGWTTTLTANIIPANKPLLMCYDGTNINAQQTGTAAASGGGYPTPVTLTASSSAELDFTTCLSASYNDYQVRFNSVVLSAGVDLFLQVSTNGGSTYDTNSSGNYKTGSYNFDYSSGSPAATTPANTGGISLTSGGAVSTTGALTGTMMLVNVNATSAAFSKPVYGTTLFRENSTADLMEKNINAVWTVTSTAYNAFRIIPASGTITSGSVTCQPLPK